MSKYETEKKWRLAHPEKIKEYRKRWLLKQQTCHREWQIKNREKVYAYKKEKYRELRIEVLGHYSKGKMCCACCGEGHLEFLCIDHIDGGGVKHRKELGGGSTNLYQYLKNNSFPPGYRVLCHNCNMSLGFYGYCPHSKETNNLLEG